jgi:hypothetical protein
MTEEAERSSRSVVEDENRLVSNKDILLAAKRLAQLSHSEISSGVSVPAPSDSGKIKVDAPAETKNNNSFEADHTHQYSSHIDFINDLLSTARREAGEMPDDVTIRDYYTSPVRINKCLALVFARAPTLLIPSNVCCLFAVIIRFVWVS